jgi:cytoskeletal protein RodZ
MPAERHPGGFGTRLREARERKGVSLRQIANATKISTSALEALERNDISRLPGGIFSRAFVRAYALEVGLEPEETIRDFIACFPNDSVTAGHPASSAYLEDSETLESNRRMATTFLRLLGISVPLAGIVLYFGVATAPPAEEDERLPVPTRGAETPAAVRSFEAPPETSPAPPSQADRLRVGLTVSGPCWVLAIVDGQRVIERQLQAGESQVLDVRSELVLTTGDAGAVAMTLNGARARQLGRAGQVVTTRLNLTNFKDHLAP